MNEVYNKMSPEEITRNIEKPSELLVELVGSGEF